MQEGEPVGVFIHLACRFMHQATDSKVRHEQSEKLLPDQFWCLAAKHDLSAAKMRLEFIEGGFHLPALVIERGQFFGWSLRGVEDGCDQSVDGLGSRNVLQAI